MESFRATPRRRIVVVVNPHATSVDRRLRELVLAALTSRYEVAVADTTAPGHAGELAAAALADGVDAVATLGGDGTLNEVADALAGSDVAIYPLPGGSQNVFAKLLGLPTEIVDSTARLLELADQWPHRQVDLGRANGRAFAFSAGVGLDASVVESVDANPTRKARWRQWYYAERGVGVFLTDYAFRAPRVRVQQDGAEIEAITVLVQNGEQFTYAGARPITVCRDVTLASGTLAAALILTGSPLRAAVTVTRMLTTSGGITDGRSTMTLGPLTELVVRSADERPLPLQVDGDFAGNHDSVRFTIEAGALRVLAPPVSSPPVSSPA